MTDTILQDKVFRNSDDDDLSRTTDIWISRIRRHIRETNCAHCKNILNENEA
ncbi:MAG: hypothetical protein WA461_06525 [Nitrososphaeraceae archaeon]